MYAPYNQVLLVPAVLALLRARKTLTARSRGFRFGYVAGAFALAWQWIASITLCAIYILASPSFALDGWKWPFFATFALPVLIFALMLVETRRAANHAAVA
jgi:MFS family permease